MTSRIRVALVGNPNTGKTTLFNELTGLHQKVGHWSGVTVEKKMGEMIQGTTTFEITDLPGIYSLNFSSSSQVALDEQITCRYLLEETPDLIINVVDANNLERNLYLTLEILEMGLPVLLALNMMDVAEQRNLSIDTITLQKKLGCPVIPLVSHKKLGLDIFKKTICSHTAVVHHHTPLWSSYLPDFAQTLIELAPQLPSRFRSNPKLSALFFAGRLLEEESAFLNPLSETVEETHFRTLLNTLRHSLSCAHHMDCDLRIADARYEMIHQLVHHSRLRETQEKIHLSEYMDRIILNRILGIPIFLFIMYLMFVCSITLGGAIQPFFDIASQTVIGEGLVTLGLSLHAPSFILIFLNSLGLGINTVLTFTPQIAALFFCLSLLERSGYMARAAFVMDRLMRWVGLPGKSFVPLIIGFGCNVPAIMAARTLDTHRDRIITILMAPFMSCGARLAIFAVFASAFFPHNGASIVFALYVIGIAIALLTGIIMRYTLLRGESHPFIMELPPYHRPMLRIIFMDMLRRLNSFILRAGLVILPFCILMGCLNTSTWHGEPLLEGIGKKITPLFTPMGIEEANWPATVGLLTGTVAKEVVIGTLNTLYTQNNASSQDFLNRGYHPYEGLKQGLLAIQDEWKNKVWMQPLSTASTSSPMDYSAMGRMLEAFGSPDRAFVYMLFVLLYIPCISTIASAAREAGRGWSLLSMIWSISIAYCVSVACYQSIHLFDHPSQTLCWYMGILLYLVCLLGIFIRWANRVNT